MHVRTVRLYKKNLYSYLISTISKKELRKLNKCLTSNVSVKLIKGEISDRTKSKSHEMKLVFQYFLCCSAKLDKHTHTNTHTHTHKRTHTLSFLLPKPLSLTHALFISFYLTHTHKHTHKHNTHNFSVLFLIFKLFVFSSDFFSTPTF